MIQSHLNSDTSDADSASALAAQQRTQESAAQERSHQLDMAEEIQHEEEEEEEEDYEEEDDEEDLLITSAAGGRAQAEDLELDEQAENAGGDS